MPNNKTNIYYTANEDEAYYLAGWINSAPVQDALQRFGAATGITPRALERLPIPEYRSTDDDHRCIVEEARACATAAVNDNHRSLTEHWQAIDRAVARIAGIDLEVLRVRSEEEVVSELEVLESDGD